MIIRKSHCNDLKKYQFTKEEAEDIGSSKLIVVDNDNLVDGSLHASVVASKRSEGVIRINTVKGSINNAVALVAALVESNPHRTIITNKVSAAFADNLKQLGFKATKSGKCVRIATSKVKTASKYDRPFEIKASSVYDVLEAGARLYSEVQNKEQPDLATLSAQIEKIENGPRAVKDAEGVSKVTSYLQQWDKMPADNPAAETAIILNKALLMEDWDQVSDCIAIIKEICGEDLLECFGLKTKEAAHNEGDIEDMPIEQTVVNNTFVEIPKDMPKEAVIEGTTEEKHLHSGTYEKFLDAVQGEEAPSLEDFAKSLAIETLEEDPAAYTEDEDIAEVAPAPVKEKSIGVADDEPAKAMASRLMPHHAGLNQITALGFNFSKQADILPDDEAISEYDSLLGENIKGIPNEVEPTAEMLAEVNPYVDDITVGLVDSKIPSILPSICEPNHQETDNGYLVEPTIPEIKERERYPLDLRAVESDQPQVTDFTNAQNTDRIEQKEDPVHNEKPVPKNNFERKELNEDDLDDSLGTQMEQFQMKNKNPYGSRPLNVGDQPDSDTGSTHHGSKGRRII